MQWSGSQGWSQAQDKPWKLGGKQVGEVTAFDTLSFVKVYQAVSTCIYQPSESDGAQLCLCFGGCVCSRDAVFCFEPGSLRVPAVCRPSCMLLTSTVLNTTAVMHWQGHMVPMDQPAASLDMINRFMQNKALGAAAADDDEIAKATGSTQQPAASGDVRQLLRLPAGAGRDSVAVV